MKKIRDIGKCVFGPGRLDGGYPGLSSTAHQISYYIPKCKIYCEPFAGLGRVAKYVKADQIILNDKSEYAYNFLKSHFIAIVTNLDFEECIKLYDSPDTFFFNDPPWFEKLYDARTKAFCDRKPIEYYQKLLELVKRIRANYPICSDHKEKEIGQMLTKSGYPALVIKSRKKIMGGYAKTKMISNRPFKIQHPVIDDYIEVFS